MGRTGERVKTFFEKLFKVGKRGFLLGFLRVFCAFFALVVSLSSARLSGRQAVCRFPTDEIDG